MCNRNVNQSIFHHIIGKYVSKFNEDSVQELVKKTCSKIGFQFIVPSKSESKTEEKISEVNEATEEVMSPSIPVVEEEASGMPCVCGNVYEPPKILNSSASSYFASLKLNAPKNGFGSSRCQDIW